MPNDASVYPPLSAAFFARPTLEVCRELLGRLVVSESPEGLCSGRIVELEAYLAPEDKASHAYGGRKTSRNAVMFGPKGRAYIYFIYGMHWCLNVVTGGPDQPQAILIRALEPVDGLELQARRRGLGAIDDRARRLVASGPSRLCQALAITGALNGHPLTEPPLYIAAGERPLSARTVARAPRIGIGYAEEWERKPLRFLVRGHACVSRPAPAKRRRL